MTLIDLEKAFNTMNHKILLHELLPIGFSKNTISWYESYLAERHFTVEVANHVSKFFKNFMWCSARFDFRSSTVFDLCQWSQALECDLYLYADDSCLLFQHKNVTEIKKTVNQRLQQYL